MNFELNFKNSATILLVAIFFSAFALYNGYPMLYPGDSFGYYFYGRYFNHDSGAHAFIYGLFVGLSSFRTSLWFVIAAQCILCSIILVLFLKTYFKNNFSIILTLILALVLVFFTTFSKYSSKIMPDIYTGLIILAFWIYFESKLVGKIKYFYILVIASLLGFHTSFILIYFLFFFIIFIFSLIFKLLEIKKKSFDGLLICVIAVLLTCFTHLIFTKKFYFNKASHTFLMAKLADYGILKDYLNTYCEQEPNELCEYKNRDFTFYSFLWDVENSPIYKTFGGNYTEAFKARKKPYNRIIINILTKPKYAFEYISISLKKTINLFPKINKFDHTGDITPHEIEHFLPHEKPQYYESKQVTGKLFLIEGYLHITQTFLVIISILFLVLKWNKFEVLDKYLIGFVAGIIILNATICVFFSEEDPRFVERIIWIIPFVFFCLIFKYYIHKSAKFFNFQK